MGFIVISLRKLGMSTSVIIISSDIKMALSEVFLTTLSVSGFAFLGAVLTVLYKSKCVRIKCCCLEIDRDVAGEEVIDRELSHVGDVGLATNVHPPV